MGNTRTPLTRSPVAGRGPSLRWQSEEFAHRLQRALIKKGWSQSDLARALWGTTTTKDGYTVARNRDRIGRYVKGINFPDPKTLTALAGALGTTPEDLAPDRMAESLEERTPQVSITQAANYPDKVHLFIDAIVPAAVAARIYSIMTEIQNASS